MVESRNDLSCGEGWIQRSQDGSELEQGICHCSKFEIVAQRNTDTIAFLDSQTLQSSRQDIALKVELIVGQALVLVP